MVNFYLVWFILLGLVQMTTLLIKNSSNPNLFIQTKIADNFFSKLLGLMFKQKLEENCGLLLSDKYESRINSSIHMLFMNFDLCVVWLDKNLLVVDVKEAKRWRLAYFPRTAAQHVLETGITHINDFSIGDQLSFENEK
ncbi:MAG: hypothetical protein ACD_34C00070G0006 [uncultured bacterium]|nr:MAG: hypothetical protein ACD_34C00070G0006 [uncultured bacterium]